MTFRQKIAEQLRKRDWKLAKLQAELADVASESAVANWAKGENPPSLVGALRIARVFGVSLEYLADDAMDEDVPVARPAGEGVLGREEETILTVFAACRRRGMTVVDVVDRMMPGWEEGRGMEGDEGVPPPSPPPGLVGESGVSTSVTDRVRPEDRDRPPEASGLGVDPDVQDVPPVEVSPPARPRRRK